MPIETVEDAKNIAIQLANEHVTWFLDTLRPLLISHFIHGYKHGIKTDQIKLDEILECPSCKATGRAEVFRR